MIIYLVGAIITMLAMITYIITAGKDEPFSLHYIDYVEDHIVYPLGILFCSIMWPFFLIVVAISLVLHLAKRYKGIK